MNMVKSNNPISLRPHLHPFYKKSNNRNHKGQQPMEQQVNESCEKST